MTLRVLMLVSGEYFEKGPHLFSKVLKGAAAKKMLKEFQGEKKDGTVMIEVAKHELHSVDFIGNGPFQISKETVMMIQMTVGRLDWAEKSLAKLGWHMNE